MEIAIIILILCFLAALIIVMRFVGAWMFRIDDVIRNQKSILEELKKMNQC